MALLVDEGHLRQIFEKVYNLAWAHGFENQVMMRPDDFFDKFLEECKKKLDK